MRPEREGGLLVLLGGLVYGMWPPAPPERILWLLAWAVFASCALLWLRLPARGPAAEGGSAAPEEPARDWAVHIAHDFRTPLMRLRLHLGALAEGNPAPQTTAAMEAEILQLERLADGLIDLTAQGSAPAGERPGDLGALASRLSDRLGPLFAQQGRALRCESEEGCRTTLDEAAAERVLENLLSNALRYAVGEGDVALRVRRDGPFFVRAEVTNPARAPGVDIETLRAPFVRGPAAEAEQGFGLGLAVVERLCGLAGGRMHLSYDDTVHRFRSAVVVPRVRRGGETA